MGWALREYCVFIIFMQVNRCMRNCMKVKLLQNSLVQSVERKSLSGMVRFCVIVLVFLLNGISSAYS